MKKKANYFYTIKIIITSSVPLHRCGERHKTNGIMNYISLINVHLPDNQFLLVIKTNSLSIFFF